MDFILAIVFATINYIRGRGYIPAYEHVVASVAWGAAAAIAAALHDYSIPYTVAVFLAVTIGMLIWMIGVIKGWGGWGLYFAAWTWTWNPDDHEVSPIDWIGFKLVPFRTAAEHWTNGLRGTICMSLRGLYITPLFFMLDLLPLGFFIGLAQGPVYAVMRWLAPANKGTAYAEPTIAALIGLTVGYRLTMGF